MLNKLFAIQRGKFLKVNIDSSSVAPTSYRAGGFKTAQTPSKQSSVNF